MVKGLVIGVIIAIVVLGAAWYLLSPLFISVEVDEAFPLDVKDNLEGMDSETRAEFDKQVEEMKDDLILGGESMPSKAGIVAEGEFKPRAHEVEGKAILIESDGKKIVRFEDFETINGPNLHIYISSDLGDDDFIDLGRIKATKGNINYEIPEGVDTEKYNKVLVWCVPFKVLFSYADLK